MIMIVRIYDFFLVPSMDPLGIIIIVIMIMIFMIMIFMMIVMIMI